MCCNKLLGAEWSRRQSRMRSKEALRNSNAPNEYNHVANACCAVKNSTEPNGTAAGTAGVLKKPCEIQMSQMGEPPRNRPEPPVEPSDFVGSLWQNRHSGCSGLVLIKILK